MKTGIQIGHDSTDKGEALGAAAVAIQTIFAAAYEYGMEQETVRRALAVLTEVGSVSNVSVSGATIRDNTVNIDDPR